MEERMGVEAAQQLVQLSSGEEEDSVGMAPHNEIKNKRKEKDAGADSNQAETWMRRGKKEEKEVEEFEEQSRPGKKLRFRSLAELYKVTKPILNGFGDDDGLKKGVKRPAN